VAETERGVVGRLSIGRNRDPLSPHVAELGLMVAAGARRRGIGSALIEEAVKWAQRAGIVKLELTVFPHNEPAIALYRKLGFREEGLLKRRYLIEGRYVDAMLMARDLD
jgi:RimJ/RimL family protein N-acetyltransferase